MAGHEAVPDLRGEHVPVRVRHLDTAEARAVTELVIGKYGATVSKLSFFFQAEDGIRDYKVTGVQTCALPISDSDRISAAGYLRTHAALQAPIERLRAPFPLLRSQKKASRWSATTGIPPRAIRDRKSVV